MLTEEITRVEEILCYDFDNDNDIDILAGGYDEESHLSWIENFGTQVFTPPQPIVSDIENLRDLRLIDFNGDDYMDVVALMGYNGEKYCCHLPQQ